MGEGCERWEINNRREGRKTGREQHCATARSLMTRCSEKERDEASGRAGEQARASEGKGGGPE
eukprot:2561058-Pleurochrysis_carterae.AAC.1